jgi:hypothetical protein
MTIPFDSARIPHALARPVLPGGTHGTTLKCTGIRLSGRVVTDGAFWALASADSGQILPSPSAPVSPDRARKMQNLKFLLRVSTAPGDDLF